MMLSLWLPTPSELVEMFAVSLFHISPWMLGLGCGKRDRDSPRSDGVANPLVG
jgi:hypothetical protein